MRLRTWLLGGAVAIIGLAAVADSVRGRLEHEPSADSAAAEEDGVAAPGLTGVLYYTDHFCLLKAIRLPEAEPVRAPPSPQAGCRFTLSPDGLSREEPTVRFAPRGRLEVAASRGLLQIYSRREPVSRPFVAAAPAFKPDGTLTFFRDGDVVEWQGGTVVLSQRRLRRTIRRALGAPRPRGVVVRDLAWLSDSRAVAILGWGPEDVVAVFEGRNVVAAWPRLGQPFRRLRTSPRGTYFALEGERGVLLFDRDGRQLPVPRFPALHGLAWSPDERWLAIAAGGRILIRRPAGGATRPPLALEIEARDLAWR
jgi:hypothetical protein